MYRAPQFLWLVVFLMSEMVESDLFYINFTSIFQVMELTEDGPVFGVTNSCQDTPF